MTPWTVTPTGAAAQLASINAAISPITTERLILRLPRLEDWHELSPIWTSERAAFIGGPFTDHDAWLDFNQLVASWVLRGHGALTITRKTDGEVLGLVLLAHEFDDPEPELGWLLTEAAEGHGYATEAAQALLPLANEIYGGAIVSYIADGNDSSARVASRLGAAPAERHPDDPDATIYRYPMQRTAS